MHTKLPFAAALILVVTPSVVSLLLGSLYHLYSSRRSQSEGEHL